MNRLGLFIYSYLIIEFVVMTLTSPSFYSVSMLLLALACDSLFIYTIKKGLI